MSDAEYTQFVSIANRAKRHPHSSQSERRSCGSHQIVKP